MWESFGTRALFQAAYGGASFGECERGVRRVVDGDIDAWHRGWTATADGLMEAVARARRRAIG